MSVTIYMLLFWTTVNTARIYTIFRGPALIWLDLQALKLGIYQIKQAEIWVLARTNRPKFWYWPDRTDRNKDIGQTE